MPNVKYIPYGCHRNDDVRQDSSLDAVGNDGTEPQGKATSWMTTYGDVDSRVASAWGMGTAIVMDPDMGNQCRMEYVRTVCNHREDNGDTFVTPDSTDNHVTGGKRPGTDVR